MIESLELTGGSSIKRRHIRGVNLSLIESIESSMFSLSLLVFWKCSTSWGMNSSEVDLIEESSYPCFYNFGIGLGPELTHRYR